MWVLSAAPILGLCLQKKHLKSYLIGFGTVLTLYAIGLIAQMLLGVKYTTYDAGYAWPLLDPNNAAAVFKLRAHTSVLVVLK
jgi:hypothetical protein